MKPFNRVDLISPDIIREGDRVNYFLVRLTNSDGSPVDVSNSNVTWSMANKKGRVIADKTAEKTSDLGVIKLGFTVGDQTGYGKFEVQIEVKNGGVSEFYPSDNSLEVFVPKNINNLEHTPVAFMTVNDFQTSVSSTLATSEEAKTKAEQAKQMSENTQEQLNTIVIEGDSSVEAAQARNSGVVGDEQTYPNLKTRLDTQINGVNSQLSDIAINVKAFGAKGDGVTDDTMAIQNAMDNLPEGSEVLLPPGTFMATSLFQRRGIMLRGAGRGATVIKQIANTSGNLINATDDDCIRWGIKDLKLDGNKKNGTNGNCLYINRNNAVGSFDTHAVIVNLEIANSSSNGVEVDLNSRAIVFKDITVAFSKNYGFYVKSSDCVLDSCVAHSSGLDGFVFTGGSHHVSNCKGFLNGTGTGDINTYRHGFYVLNQAEIYFTNCFAQQNYGNGWRIENSRNITLSSCGGSWNSVSDNSANSAGTNLYAGLFITDSHHVITKGFVANDPKFESQGIRNQRYGVRIRRSTDLDIDCVVTNHAFGYELYVEENTEETPSSLSNNRLIMNGKIVTKENKQRTVYAEGTWVPELKSDTGTSNHAYTIKGGSWTLVGRQVTLQGRINISGTGFDASSTGNVQIKNIPFTSTNTFPGNFTRIGDVKWKAVTLSTGYSNIKVQNDPGTNTLTFYQYGNGVEEAPLPHSNLKNWSNVVFTITFWI